jgi:hypothetical protein
VMVTATVTATITASNCTHQASGHSGCGRSIYYYVRTCLDSALYLQHILCELPTDTYPSNVKPTSPAMVQARDGFGRVSSYDSDCRHRACSCLNVKPTTVYMTNPCPYPRPSHKAPLSRPQSRSIRRQPRTIQRLRSLPTLPKLLLLSPQHRQSQRQRLSPRSRLQHPARAALSRTRIPGLTATYIK